MCDKSKFVLKTSVVKMSHLLLQCMYVFKHIYLHYYKYACTDINALLFWRSYSKHTKLSAYSLEGGCDEKCCQVELMNVFINLHNIFPFLYLSKLRYEKLKTAFYVFSKLLFYNKLIKFTTIAFTVYIIITMIITIN